MDEWVDYDDWLQLMVSIKDDEFDFVIGFG
jgi:hypothetical protein